MNKTQESIAAVAVERCVPLLPVPDLTVTAADEAGVLPLVYPTSWTGVALIDELLPARVP